MKKHVVWIALVVVPLLYALTRNSNGQGPWPLVLAFILHWGLACLVIAWTRTELSGSKSIRLPRVLSGLIFFAVAIAVYCAGLIALFGSQPLAGWQHVQMRGLGRWGVILIAVSAGFCEELIYRGYMMTALKRVGQSVWLAMTLSTLSFVFFHGIPPLPFLVGGFIIGMIWATIYQKTSNLWVTVWIHGLWDATVLLVPWDSGSR